MNYVKTKVKEIYEKNKARDLRETEKQIAKKNRNEALLNYRKNFVEVFKKGKEKNLKLSKFIEDLNATPEIVCDCCYRLCFRSDSKEYEIEKLYISYTRKSKDSNDGVSLSQFQVLVKRPPVSNERYMCGTCYNTIYNGRIPIYGPQSGIKLIPISEALSILSDLEERSVSPFIPFMQIRELKPFNINTYTGIKGPIINVDVNINDFVNILPRKFNELSVQQIMLKRHLDHKSYYMFETVNEKHIIDAIAELRYKTLYKDYKFNIDEDAFRDYDHLRVGDHINFIVDESLIDKNEKNFLKEFKKKENEVSCLDELNKEENPLRKNQIKHEIVCDLIGKDCSGKNDNEELMKQVKLEEQFYGKEGRETDLLVVNLSGKEEIKVIAPGQGNTPKRFYEIDNYLELAFPCCSGGEPLNYDKEKISQTKLFKHLIQYFDRRYTCPKCLFLMGKVKLCLQLQNAISTACRISKCKGLTVQDVLDKCKLSEMIQCDDCFRFMKKITISPAYLLDKKRIMFAYFRQLGLPSFFLTLSPAESFWSDLLKQLYKNKLKRDITDIDALNLNDGEKADLIRNDPVLCVQYFNRKSRKVMEYLKTKNNKVFGENYVTDECQRLEYQVRGGSHSHKLLYCKNFPQYNKDMTDEAKRNLIQKVDSTITTKFDVNNPNILHQVHICTFTCWKYRIGIFCFFFIIIKLISGHSVALRAAQCCHGITLVVAYFTRFMAAIWSKVCDYQDNTIVT